MKARIVNGHWRGNYTDKWIERNWNKKIHGTLVSEWDFIDTPYTGDFIEPIWNGEAYEEDASTETINKYQSHNEKIEDSNERIDIEEIASDLYRKYRERLIRKVKKGDITKNQSKTIRLKLQPVFISIILGDMDIAVDMINALSPTSNKKISAEIEFIKNRLLTLTSTT